VKRERKLVGIGSGAELRVRREEKRGRRGEA